MITVKVTAEDIAEGIPRNAHACPIARAASRATGYYCEVTGFIYLFQSSQDAMHVKSYRMPAPALKFMRDFDRELLVEPFEFTVDT